MKRFALAALAAAALLAPAAARADATSRDSVYLVGEFVDPVCLYQHGMQGVDQRACALMRGRVNQGIHFLDLRGRRVYTVIGMQHTDDPYAVFFRLLGDTIAVSGKVWTRFGSRAIAITNVWPWRGQPTPRYAAWPWSWHLSTLIGCGLLALAYLLALTLGRRRLGAPHERFERARAVTFLGSLAVVLGSLNGPLHDLSDNWFFWTHMVQHLLLAQLFPLLLLLGIPPWLADRLLAPRRVRRAWEALTDYRVGFTLYTGVFTAWHLPILYDLMMRAHGFHIVMHLMVMATATLMWWPFVGTATRARILEPPAQMLYALVLSTPMMMIAACITFARTPLYQWYALAPRLWPGFDAGADQRLGALIMWIPGTMVYWAILSVIFLRWSHRRENTASDHDLAIPPVPRRV